MIIRKLAEGDMLAVEAALPEEGEAGYSETRAESRWRWLLGGLEEPRTTADPKRIEGKRLATGVVWRKEEAEKRQEQRKRRQALELEEEEALRRLPAVSSTAHLQE
jgi:hypothetical protein